ncbi:insulin degrading metalloproteinase isoform X1 [Colletes latitarsis]|uniref:insulin degrading metalloproteinase isoform X1 n=2 Tax=Colletes latitarsis TaxID=2605962 RepID=UPI0040353F97
MIFSLVLKSRIFHTPVQSLSFYGYKSSKRKIFAGNMHLHDYVEKRYDNITKSPNDKEEYRGLLLANKMKVLIISNPTTDESAASLDVNIGYLNDPDDLPGLAHFCEHMLFLGTKAYPQENEYKMFLSQNGGLSNASTHMDHTTYYFHICPDKLKDALYRFAQFFIEPLFTETATELELNAIHLEHVKNATSDAWRIGQVEKSSAKSNHPFRKFGNGNKETLDVIPKAKGINTREKLLEFYEKYYSANIMSLCIYGKESLDELEKMTVEFFSQVKNKEVDLPVYLEHPFDEEHFRTKWYIVPIKDTRHLDITFPLPDLREHYKAAPAYYILYLLGHEGEGSLLSLLKSKGWCNLLASSKRLGARGFCFFNLIVDLTEEGIQHVDDIILLIFQYINMLKKHGPVEWIYNEYRDIANMNFQFKEKYSPTVYVTNLVTNLQEYTMEEVLVGEQLIPLWKPDLIKEIMEYLTPEKIRINVIGQIYESVADETEKWYGTKFKREKIPQNIINSWMNAGYNPELKLPIKNEFIPEKFDIKSAENNITKFPTIIEDTPLLRLWFKQDDEFLVPKAKMVIDFVSPLTYMDPLSYNLSYMFVQLFRDVLNEYTYYADLAGLLWTVNNNKYGITIEICGYDNKQYVLLNKILDKMMNFEIDPKRFEVLKESYMRSLKNFEAEQPYMHAIYYLAVLLSEQAWTKHELLKAISQLTIEGLRQFIPQFLSKVHIECLIHGNVTMSEALEAAKLIESKLTSTVPQMIPLLSRQLILNREIRLEDGCHFLFEVDNKLHHNSCTEVYYQTGLQSTQSNMLLELVAQIISEPCYSTLRTKEQLGYVIFSGIQKMTAAEGLRIIIQSDKHPRYVEERIDIFLEAMLHHITNMTEEEFDRHKESLATQILQKPKTLIKLSNVFWVEISSQQYSFDRPNIQTAYLRTITLEQISDFYKKIIQRDTQHKLSVHVISTADDSDSETAKKDVLEPNEDTQSSDTVNEVQYKKIDDIMAFKISQSLYPLVKPPNNIPRKGAHSSKL